MKRVVLATNNAHKADEIRAVFADRNWEIVTLKEAGIESDPVEDANSFEGNARIKAQAAHRIGGGVAVIADDSGLEVDALEGAPGVRSARFAGEHATDAQNNQLLLEQLAEVSDEKRTARFVCTLVFIDEDDSEVVAQGQVEGRIGYTPQGTFGFGYDPLFLPNEYEGKLTFAEVPPSEKNEISHRARALRALAEQIG